jgi:hypothetical protein
LAPAEIDGGNAARLATERHRWEEAVITFRKCNTVEQALKKQIVMVFEPMYLEIINNDMVGFVNTTARDMLEHLFLSYGSITEVDLEHKFENMRNAWDCLLRLYSSKIKIAWIMQKLGGVTISDAHKLTTAYTKVFSTGNLHSACRRWNERNTQDKTWNNFKIHFAMAYLQHKKIQGESAATSEYANAAVAQPADDDLAEVASDAFTNLARDTSVDRGIVATLTDANSCFAN